MLRSNEVKKSSTKPNPGVPILPDKLRTGQPPNVRAAHRGNMLGLLPDELFREIGKYLTLGEWVALRQLEKALAQQVDRQPPFILLEPDSRTDKLLEQFLTDDTSEYAHRLGNLLGNLDISRIMGDARAAKIYNALAKAGAWDCLTADASRWKNTSTPSQPPKPYNLRFFGAPLLRQLGQSSPHSLRKLCSQGRDLDRGDLPFVREMQKSSCLRLITLKTKDVNEFLPFIAGSAEFSDLDLDLASSEGLTLRTFHSLQQMQGAVRHLTLSQMASCASGLIQSALCDKQLESLTLVSANNVDLLPWLSMPISSLKLVRCTVDATTFDTALGSTRSLKVLDMSGLVLSLTPKPPGTKAHAKKGENALPSRAEAFRFSQGLRSNQSIEKLLLRASDLNHFLNTDPACLLDGILNHDTIRHIEWTEVREEWPRVYPPENPKAMDEIFLGMSSRNLYGITHLLDRLASLKRLRLQLYDYDFNADMVNLKFLSMLPKLGVEDFSLDAFEPDNCDYKNLFSIPFKDFIWSGLRRLTLDVSDGYNIEGMAEAIGSTTTLEFLRLDRFDAALMGKALIKGLIQNESLRVLIITTCELEMGDANIQSALMAAEIIEAIVDHANIDQGVLDFNFNDEEDGMYVPYGADAILKRLKPGLHLWGITDSLPEGATPEQIEALTDIYERIVQDVDSGTSEG